MTLRSPYEAALGERLEELHPVLRRYFSALPEGCAGVGEGVFAEFGATRRWLRPLLRPFERRGVLLADHARSVPFRLVNRTVRAADGSGLAVAMRELDLPGRAWIMTDSVALAGQRVVDRLGTPWTASASFDLDVRDGSLLMRSRSVGLVLGRVRIRLPRTLSPIVRLTESHDPVSGLQRVELTVDAPLLGRVYGYRGHFAYAIVRDAEGADRAG